MSNQSIFSKITDTLPKFRHRCSCLDTVATTINPPPDKINKFIIGDHYISCLFGKHITLRRTGRRPPSRDDRGKTETDEESGFSQPDASPVILV